MRKTARSGEKIAATGTRRVGKAKSPVTTQKAPKVPVISQIGMT